MRETEFQMEAVLAVCGIYLGLSGLILGLCPANDRQGYIVMTSLIDTAQA